MADANGGQSAGHLIPSDLAELATQVQALRDIIDDVQALGSRSILGSIENLTDKALTFVNDEIEAGGYGVRQPELQIPPRSPMVFTANNSGPDTVGRVDYRTDDGVIFGCGWSNPLIGAGRIWGHITPNSPRYGMRIFCSTGNTNSLRRWVIFPLPGHPVAFNPQDRFVVTIGNRILVTINDGRVFGHDVDGGGIVGSAFQLGGPPVAFNPQDNFVVTMGNQILVIVDDGRVFGHDINGNTIGPAFQLDGPPVAFNYPEIDRFVVAMGNRILVITKDGRVFGHDIAGNTIGAAFQLGGPPVAFNPQDNFVVTMGNRILVIVDDGRVFGHDMDGNTISPAFQLGGPPVAFNYPEIDRFVVTMGDRILVITKDGRVFGHQIVDNVIGSASLIN